MFAQCTSLTRELAGRMSTSWPQTRCRMPSWYTPDSMDRRAAQSRESKWWLSITVAMRSTSEAAHVNKASKREVPIRSCLTWISSTTAARDRKTGSGASRISPLPHGSLAQPKSRKTFISLLNRPPQPNHTFTIGCDSGA